MNQAHPDDELLSASLDGEALDHGVRTHLDGCAACRSRLDALEAVRRSVAAAPGGAPEGLADRAVAAALGAWSEERAGNVVPLRRRDDPGHLPTAADAGPGSAPRRRMPAWALGAAAAVVAVLVAVPVVSGLGGGRDGQTASAPRESLTSTGLGAGDELLVEGGDLGEQSDQDALGRIVEGAVSGGGGGRAPMAAAAPEDTAGAEDAAGPASESAPAAPAPGAPGRAQAPASTVTGSFQSGDDAPCAEEVRATYGEGLGPLVYRATVRWQGAPAVVLAYRLADADGVGPDHRAFVMAIEGCRLLVVQGF